MAIKQEKAKARGSYVGSILETLVAIKNKAKQSKTSDAPWVVGRKHSTAPATLEYSIAVSHKVKPILAMSPSSATSKDLPKKNENLCPHRGTC